MSRLTATLRLDVRQQARNQLYAIGVAVALILGLVLRYVLDPEVLRFLLPLLFLGSVGGTTYMFAAAMLLFEKSGRTIDALTVSPLHLSEYVASKLVTLVGFAVIESVIVLLVGYGWRDFSPGVLLLGLVVMGAQYTLFGLAQVAAHESVTDFLIPGAVFASIVLQAPAMDLLAWPSLVWYVIPTQAPLLLLRAAFGPIEPWQWAYAIAYSAISLWGAWMLVRRQFRRHLAMGRR